MENWKWKVGRNMETAKATAAGHWARANPRVRLDPRHWPETRPQKFTKNTSLSQVRLAESLSIVFIVLPGWQHLRGNFNFRYSRLYLLLLCDCTSGSCSRAYQEDISYPIIYQVICERYLEVVCRSFGPC